MKFAKELDQEAVPEWRIKYLNYKAGKKYVTALSRAVQRANATPQGLGDQTPSFYTAQSERPTPNALETIDDDSDETDSLYAGPQKPQTKTSSSSRPILVRNGREQDALTSEGNVLQYGSFVATPPAREPAPIAGDSDKNPYELPVLPFELPAPAICPPAETRLTRKPSDVVRKGLGRVTVQRSVSDGARHTRGTGSGSSQGRLLPKRHVSCHVQRTPSQLKRLFSHRGASRTLNKNDFGMTNFDLVRERENDFFDFMDSELAKVESFYREKEEQAGKRLALLKEQLYEMRNRRILEIDDASRPEDQSSDGEGRRGSDADNRSNTWVRHVKAKIFPPGPNSKAFQVMPNTPHFGALGTSDGSRDYIRRPEDNDVSYRTAKRKLKLALQEFYRGLELLKQYSLLNRTAFRKMNKKFDKAVNARPPYRYMNEKVNNAWFVKSDVLEGHIKVVEDLYARYFERGNRKLAAGKLRSLNKKPSDQSNSLFQNGFLIGTALVLSVQGVIYGSQLLVDDDLEVRQQTSYLMQIYAGYFLMLLSFSLFCVNCMIWTKSKINYPFIFEFDQRHHLDWASLAEFPSFFFLLFGLFIWTNFSRYGPDEIYVYYPVILIGITVIVIFLPFPVLAHRSRKWFAYSHWRLLCAGFYPVEFRDFFLGDIYCSLAYATANAELFFCLAAHQWDNPVQCNSSHSRAMGFLSALPPIWRFLQCIRRYKDTRNIFPHLVNCGKYAMTIMSAVTLSMYRIQGTSGNLALFVTFSLVNSIYCSIWDLFMDFSLLQAGSRHLGLRDILALKARWPYYAIMVVDPIIRFGWILYAIFTYDRQHSTIVSFLVALMEVIRRGMWATFRVENEHCANVSQYKASRDVPLPYRIEPLLDHSTSPSASSPCLTPTHQAQPQDPEGRVTASSTGFASAAQMTHHHRRRLGATLGGWSFSKVLAEAHKQDFEKKRRTPAQAAQEEAQEAQSDDDDDDEITASEVGEARELRRRGTGGAPR